MSPTPSRGRRGLKVIVATPLLLILLLALTSLVYDPLPGPLRLPRRVVTDTDGQVSFVDRGAGPPVVLIHGAMGSAEDFETLLPLFESRYRVLAVDRPGFGHTSLGGDDHTYSGNARRIAAWLSHLRERENLPAPIVLGHSRGAGVALHLALHLGVAAPDALRGLVLLSPSGLPMAKPDLLAHLIALPAIGPGLAAWVSPLLAPKTIRAVLDGVLGPDAKNIPPGFIDERIALWSAPRSLAARARQTASQNAETQETSRRFGEITLPTEILSCDADPTEGVTLSSRGIAELMPRARFTTLVGCGHYGQYTHPRALAEAVNRLAEGAP